MHSKYDLEVRTQDFGKAVIDLCREILPTTVTNPLISQLIRSSTSIGANYCEADNAESRPDFKHKLGICKKESKETIHWLIMIEHVLPNLRPRTSLLINEARELNLIFNAIIHKINKNDKLS